ncbi:MAG: twin-arginine translocase subunit TatC [Chlamydiota bacterium]|nr:twin-arginine translocase subunit TatC [Chlamydiota bacterium]
MKSHPSHASFWDHVDALRDTFIKILITISVGSFVAFICSPIIYSSLIDPSLEKSLTPLSEIKLERVRITNNSKSTQTVNISSNQIKKLPPGASVDVWKEQKKNLQILSPTEGMITTFKLALWIGIVATSPIWLYQLLSFILPALHSDEKRVVFPIFTSSILLFSLGLLFCHSVTLPIANEYLANFNEQIGLNTWSLDNYVNYSIILMLGNGLAFEGIAILFCLVHWRIIGSQGMKEKRKHFAVGAFILAAIVTPPDIFTQAMLAIPLILLYELSIYYAMIREGFKTKLHNKLIK